MKIETINNYVCNICGKKGVRLWRPSIAPFPLVCEKCARKRPPIEPLPDSEGVPENLILMNLSKDYSGILFMSGTTLMEPAYPAENGAFWKHYAAPDDVIKWWNELPTE